MKDLLEIQEQPKKITFKEIEEQRRKSSQYARRISAEVRREAREIINSPTILEKKRKIKDNSNKVEDSSQPLIVRYKKKKRCIIKLGLKEIF